MGRGVGNGGRKRSWKEIDLDLDGGLEGRLGHLNPSVPAPAQRSGLSRHRAAPQPGSTGHGGGGVLEVRMSGGSSRLPPSRLHPPSAVTCTRALRRCCALRA